MVNVALVSPRFAPKSPTGGDISTTLLAEGLRRQGADVLILTDRMEGQLWESDAGFEVHEVHSRQDMMDRLHDREIVHVYNNGQIMITARKAAKALGIPAVATANSYWATCLWADMTFPDGSICRGCHLAGLRKDYLTRNPETVGRRVPPIIARAEVRRRTKWLSSFDAVIALSEASATHLKAGGVSGRMEVIPNMAEWWMYSDELRIEAPGPMQMKPEILFVGQLKHTKGVDTLIEAMADVIREIPTAILRIIGDGPERSRLWEIIEDCGLQSRVFLLDYIPRERMAPLWRQSKVLAFPTVWTEPFGRVILEAWAYGVPPVVGNGGPLEIVNHGVSGLHVPMASPEGLADVLIDLLTDPNLHVKLRRGGWESLNDYHPNKIMRRVLTLYDELIG